jgi:hypothetical protein
VAIAFVLANYYQDVETRKQNVQFTKSLADMEATLDTLKDELDQIRADQAKSPPPLHSLLFTVDEPRKHLGHDTEKSTGIHRASYDGAVGRLTDFDEPFAVYWDHFAAAGPAFNFEKGKTYRIEYRGDLQGGVIGHEGKCLDASRMVNVTAEAGPPVLSTTVPPPSYNELSQYPAEPAYTGSEPTKWLAPERVAGPVNEEDTPAQKEDTDDSTTKTLLFTVTAARTHLGHATEAKTLRHPIWYDGCRGRLADSGEDLFIYWGTGIENPYTFENGVTYVIKYRGSLKNKFMGTERTCLSAANIISVAKKQP